MPVESSEAPSKTEDTTVVVSRVVSHPLKSVWNELLTPTGTEALLGAGGQLGDKGDSWRAHDGTCGVVRSFHPLEQIRFSWHRHADAPKTLVDVHLIPHGDSSTLLEIRHEHLGTEDRPDDLRSHWEDALDRIERDAL